MKTGTIAFLILILLLASLSPQTTLAEYGDIVEIIPLSIDSFTFRHPDANSTSIRVEFSISGSEGSFDYVISAAVIANGTLEGSRDIAEGRGQLGEVTQVNANLGDLGSFANYSLILTVYKDYEGIEESATAVAHDTFSFVNHNMMPAPSGFDIEIDLTDFAVAATWGAFLDHAGDEWIFAVMDGSDEVFYIELDRNVTVYAVHFEPDATEVTVELSYRRGDRISSVLSKTILIEDILFFDFDEFTDSLQGTIRYNTVRNAFVDVSLFSIDDPMHYDDRGEAREETFESLQISGSGFFSINFKEFSNSIEVRWAFDQNDASADGVVNFVKHIEVYADLLPPRLRLPENNAIIYTDDSSFVIAGITDFGATIFVDGREVPVNDDGGFLAAVDLQGGKNVFAVTAMIGQNNQTTQIVTIFRTDPASRVLEARVSFVERYPALLISFLASLIFIAFAFCFVRRYNNKWNANRIEEAACLIRNISIPFFVLSTGYFIYALIKRLDSERYLNSRQFAVDGLSEAGRMVDTVVAYQKNLIQFQQARTVLIIMSVAFVSASIFSILAKFMRKSNSTL